MASPGPRRREGAASTNVRESPSSFVGRKGDLSAIQARFDDGARLVTLLSPGGMGKTRAATRFARLHGDDFAAHGGSGAWFCDLTDAASVDAICGVVVAELDVPLGRGADERALIEEVGRAIARRKRVLIVLDNLEHLAKEAARVVRAWMSLAPDARFLATSRAVLGVPGEHLVHLEPLSLPRSGQSAEEILAAESVDLFVRRAREVRPDFDPGAGDLATLVEVVRATDGIPLAIELAAARVAVLTLEQLKRRLALPLDLLVRRDDTGKHASMRRVVIDSFAQLDEGTRARLAASSVFRGGFTLEAAEDVLGGPREGVLATLESLVARSLLRAREAAGELRFSCFEAIRELGAEELSALPGARDRAAAAHARHYAAWGDALAEEAATAGGSTARARLAREIDNLVAAHAQAIDEAKRAPAGEGSALSLSLALALAPVLMERGQLALCRSVLDAAIFVASLADTMLPGFGAALVARGIARREIGEWDRAKHDLEEALALAQASSDVALEAHAAMRWGEIVEALGETAEARAHFARALDRLERAPIGRARRAREAEIRARLGHAHRRESDLDAAERETRRALALYRETGCDDELPTALYEAGVIALFRRRYAEARACFDEALGLARASGSKQAEGALSSALGILVQEQGNLDEALGYHADAVRSFREIGSRLREGSALYYLGTAFLERGAVAEASKRLAQAFDVMHAAGMPRYEVLIAGCLAVAASDAGDGEIAQEWLEKARAAASACVSEPALQATLGIHAAHVALGSAGLDTAERAALVEQARALAADCSNDDVRFALRSLLAQTRIGSRAPATALVIRGDGGEFRVPGAASAVDLSRRAPLRRILFVLATSRVEAPGGAALDG